MNPPSPEENKFDRDRLTNGACSIVHPLIVHVWTNAFADGIPAFRRQIEVDACSFHFLLHGVTSTIARFNGM